MKMVLRKIGIGMMSLAVFGMVLIPASPADAAVAAGGAVDILRDSAMLARVKKADPHLYARIATQTGDVRARITATEFRKLKRLGAKEFSSQRKNKHATDFSSQKKKATAKATDFSSQTRLTVPLNPFKSIVADLEAASKFWDEVNTNMREISASFPVVAPVTSIIATVASFIKLIIVDPALRAAKVAEALYATGEKTLAELPRCFPFWPFFCRAQ